VPEVQPNNIELNAGVDFFARIHAFDSNDRPADLTGYVATAQIREGYSNNLVGTFVATPAGKDGTIDLFMDSVSTALIPSRGGYIFDVVIKNQMNGDSQVVARGLATVMASISA